MRSVLKHIKVGQQQVVQVLRVEERGSIYIDLSKKFITETERIAGNEKYNKGKTVHNITKRVAETQHKDIEEIYKTYIWPLYHTHDHPCDAFKTLATTVPAALLAIGADQGGGESGKGPVDIWQDVPNTTPDIKMAFINLIKHQMALQPVKMGAQIEVMCYTEGGIDDIKRALKAGLDKQSLNNNNVKIQLISSPLYLLWTTALDEEKGNEALNDVIEEIKQRIMEIGGIYRVIQEPRVIGKVDA
jgi:translation initiation factor 2 alpha subunit (eIF-2alpha)